MISLLSFIIVIGVLIFVHELGHFVTAKMVDIEVPRFSIGLGPKLWGFRWGETEYVISWLPLGGYVKMAGMEEMEAIEGGEAKREDTTGVAGATDVGLLQETGEGRTPGPRDFESKSLPARVLVISAGVIMNILFALVVFSASAWIWGVEREPEARVPEVTAEALPPGAESLLGVPRGARVVAVDGTTVEDWGDLREQLLTASPGPITLHFEGAPPATIEVAANDTLRAGLIRVLEPELEPVIGGTIGREPAAVAGLRKGDRILSVAGQPVATWRQLVSIIQSRPGQPTELTFERDGRTLSVEVVPTAQEFVSPSGETETVGRIGAAPLIERNKIGLVESISHGTERTWNVATMIVGFLGDLITGKASPRNLGGPILIGQLSGEVARAGLEEFLNFMALFSVNLAVLNLLPIPVLDGGHLLFLAIEGVRGRALSFEQRMRFTQVGLVLVIALMVWAFASDILRLFGI